jgi:cytochrome oxidase Cu insertion factor (SCO1/SenC/PrrC family)
MIPMALVVVAGYLALRPLPAPAPEPATQQAPATQAPAAEAAPAATSARPPRPLRPGRPARPAWRPSRLLRAFGAASTRAVLAAWAVAIILLGAAPMALAQVNRDASPIIAQAIDGDAAPLNFTAPAFTLTDQNGRTVSLASLHGKVVLLTFLDPVCTSDCPVIGTEFKEADQILGAKARSVEMVAIVANPQYRSTVYTQAFDHEDQLASLPNWLYLTGSLPQLEQAWKNYDVSAQILPAGGMVLHQDVAYVIDGNGKTRAELNFDPGPSTSSTESSFAVELASAAEHVMKTS